MCHVVLKGDFIGLHRFIGQDPHPLGLSVGGQSGQHGLLKVAERVQRFFNKPVGTCRQGIAGKMGIARNRQQGVNTRLRARQFLYQVDAVAVRQPQIGNHHRGAVNLQMPSRRAHAIGPSDPRT